MVTDERVRIDCKEGIGCKDGIEINPVSGLYS